MKNIRKFLLDFFALFAAVTLGFFAENLRENMAEARLESRLMSSFYYELGQDSIILAANKKHNAQLRLELDEYLSWKNIAPTSEQELDTMMSAAMALRIYGVGAFYSSSVSLDQMAATGVLSEADLELAVSIARYRDLNGYGHEIGDKVKNFGALAWASANQVFNWKYRHYHQDTYTVYFAPTAEYLQYYNNLDQLRGLLNHYDLFLANYLDMVGALRGEIAKRYDVEENAALYEKDGTGALPMAKDPTARQ